MRRSIRSLMLSGVAVAFYGQTFICRQNQPGDDFAALPGAAGYVNAAAEGATHLINNNTASSTPFVTPDGSVYFRGTDNKLFCCSVTA